MFGQRSDNLAADFGERRNCVRFPLGEGKNLKLQTRTTTFVNFQKDCVFHDDSLFPFGLLL